ncbi:hypothetical protein HDU76_013023 [Blyttiomyces sp. JEL0837]|nr:hypothetical protein HDU76_013023 [Blyttiomyces sp. JEL0837]
MIVMGDLDDNPHTSDLSFPLTESTRDNIMNSDKLCHCHINIASNHINNISDKSSICDQHVPNIATLPTEIVQLIFGHLSIPHIWRQRRLCHRLKNCAESTFASKLRSSKHLFDFHLVVLASRGGPWFHTPSKLYDPTYTGNLNLDGVEDHLLIPLSCTHVDMDEQTITLSANIPTNRCPITGSSSTSTESSMIFDMDMDDLPTQSPTTKSKIDHQPPAISKRKCNPLINASGTVHVDPKRLATGPMTLHSAHHDLESVLPFASASNENKSSSGSKHLSQKRSIMSFDFFAEYTVTDFGGIEDNREMEMEMDITTAGISSKPISHLHFDIHSVKISFSYLFTALCVVNSSNNVIKSRLNTTTAPTSSSTAISHQLSFPLPPRTSVFPTRLIQMLHNATVASNLPWDPIYESFDVVIHWLMINSIANTNDVELGLKDVVEFLIEHNRVMCGKVGGAKGGVGNGKEEKENRRCVAGGGRMQGNARFYPSP